MEIAELDSLIDDLSIYTPLPDLPEQPENVQRPGSEVVEKGMLT